MNLNKIKRYVFKHEQVITIAIRNNIYFHLASAKKKLYHEVDKLKDPYHNINLKTVFSINER